MASRSEEREGFPPEFRMRLLEGDVDRLEKALQFISRTCIGILVTLVTLLALQVIVQFGGGS